MILDVNALNQRITPLVQTLVWGAIAMAAIIPVATAVGSVVAKKIDKR